MVMIENIYTIVCLDIKFLKHAQNMLLFSHVYSHLISEDSNDMNKYYILI